MKETVFVAGHKGMVGSAIVRLLSKRADFEILTLDRQFMDLTNQREVDAFFAENSIDVVFLAAARVGGIHANSTYPASFLYENLIIQANVIEASRLSGVNRLLVLGSTCIYPRMAPQPVEEKSLLTGSLEPTNEAYAIAKIAGLKLAEFYRQQHDCDYRCLMPTNLYGYGDNFTENDSHVVPALVRRFHEAKVGQAKSVTIWGSGKATRDFLHVDDLARACVSVMDMSYDDYERLTSSNGISFLNVGSGTEISIADLAIVIKDVVGYSGNIIFDDSKPDGTPRKATNCEIFSSTGWAPEVRLRDGLIATYEDFMEGVATGKVRL